MGLTPEMRCFGSMLRQERGHRLGSFNTEESTTGLLKLTSRLSVHLLVWENPPQVQPQVRRQVQPQVRPRPLAWILCLLFSSASSSSAAEGATTAAPSKERTSRSCEKAVSGFQ